MSETSMADVLLQGWDDDEEAVTEVAQPTIGEVEQPEEEEVPAAPEEQDEPTPDEQEEETEEPSEDDEESETPEEEDVAALALEGFDTTDPQVLAYLAQYQNDPLRALRAAAEIKLVFDRQATELGKHRQRVQELEFQQAQQRALSGGMLLNAEQVEWAEAAAASANPGAYVQQAMEAGQFDLARAVCTSWAREDPFNAGRAGQWVDGVEQQARQPQAFEAPTEEIVDALKAKVPGFSEWEPQMVAVFNGLGPDHHLVQEARSNNIDVSMRALMTIFDIAKASTASVAGQREEIKRRAREESAGAKAAAAVTSSGNAPSLPGEPPRNTQILPGLTLEDLETEFAAA